MAFRNELVKQDPVKSLNRINGMVSGMDAVWNQYQKDPSKNKQNVDQSLIYTLNKVLDDTSAVREGEYDRTQEGTALLTKLGSLKDKYSKGGIAISDEVRGDIYNTIKMIQNGRQKFAEPIINFYRDEAMRANVDPARVTGVIGTGVTNTDAPPVSNEDALLQKYGGKQL